MKGEIDTLHKVFKLTGMLRWAVHVLTKTEAGSQWEGFDTPWDYKRSDLGPDRLLELFKRVAWGYEPHEADFAFRSAPGVLLQWLSNLTDPEGMLSYVLHSVGPFGVAGILRGEHNVSGPVLMDTAGSLVVFCLHHNVVSEQSGWDQSQGFLDEKQEAQYNRRLKHAKSQLSLAMGLEGEQAEAFTFGTRLFDAETPEMDVRIPAGYEMIGWEENSLNPGWYLIRVRKLNERIKDLEEQIKYQEEHIVFLQKEKV